MLRKILILAFVWVLGFSVQSYGAESMLRQEHPDRYTVVKGDTLWDISGRFLNKPWYWPEIWHVNPQIANPHLIFPGDVIGLVYIDGRPMLTVLERNGDLKLSPQKRYLPLEEAIPLIPLDVIRAFINHNRIVSPEELEAAPYVLKGAEGRLIMGVGDSLYARDRKKTHAGESSYGLYRKNRYYQDPVTGETLGLEAKSLGFGQVAAVDGEVITLTLKATNSEIRQEDRLLPVGDDVFLSSYKPSKPPKDIRGFMIAVDGGVTQIGQYHVVVLNKGTREGLEIGNVFEVYSKNAPIRDSVTGETVELPSVKAGLVMVFQTFEKMSYALVMQANQSMAVMDEIRSP